MLRSVQNHLFTSKLLTQAHFQYWVHPSLVQKAWVKIGAHYILKEKNLSPYKSCTGCGVQLKFIIIYMSA